MDALWDIQTETETNLKVAIALWKAKDLDAVQVCIDGWKFQKSNTFPEIKFKPHCGETKKQRVGLTHWENEDFFCMLS